MRLTRMDSPAASLPGPSTIVSTLHYSTLTADCAAYPFFTRATCCRTTTKRTTLSPCYFGPRHPSHIRKIASPSGRLVARSKYDGQTAA